MSEDPTKYSIDEEELGALLHRLLIVEGQAEVEIVHPVDGMKVVTRENYLEMVEHIKRAEAMSPAERMTESKRIERKKQMEFRTALIKAKVYIVNIDDDANFGKDVDGEDMPIGGKLFTAVDTYPKGTETLDNELGAFFDESLREPPIRIRSKDPLPIPGEAVETNEREHPKQ